MACPTLLATVATITWPGAVLLIGIGVLLVCALIAFFIVVAS